MKKAIVILSCLFLASCGQWAASQGYGTHILKLPCNTKFINAVWKGRDGELWYIYRPMHSNEIPENVIFQASTIWGVWEGKVTFIESKCET